MCMENIIKNYLESGGLHCHYCNSSNILASHKYADSSFSEIYLSGRCNACGKCWTARYKQIGIVEKSGKIIVQHYQSPQFA